MRLSKRGWNNVLIFGVLLIIFIFHFSQQLNLSSQNSQRSIIPPALTIVEIITPDYTITRVGRDWKSEPNMGMSSEKLDGIVNNWQNIPLDTLVEQNTPHSDFAIKFFAAEMSQPIVVQMHQQEDDHYIVEIDGQQFLSLPADKLTLFLGK